MLGRRDRGQRELFIAGSLDELIPEDYILKKVDGVLDLSWLRAEMEPLYCADNGRPGIDPEAAVRLMLAGFFHGIVHDRKLMREANMHLGIRWFAGFALHETLPDHSSLTRLRQRWGADRFRRIFERTVADCMRAGLVSGQTVHVDSTLIRADVSWESLVEVHAEKVLSENETTEEADADAKPRRGRPVSRTSQPKKRSTTDPDATLTTSSKEFRMQPSYKQHTAVDDKAGVVVDAEVTTGEQSEGAQLLDQLGRVEQVLGQKPSTITADGGYAHARNYQELEKRSIDAIIPVKLSPRNTSHIPASRFKYDARHDVVRCPAGKHLHRSSQSEQGWTYRARTKDCRDCPLRAQCFGTKAKVRTILIVPGHEALVRARRRHLRRDESDRNIYRRHRWLVEGRHGEAKIIHGLARAIRRGLANVRIQAYLTAAVMNLKRLARALCPQNGLFWIIWGLFYVHCIVVWNKLRKIIEQPSANSQNQLVGDFA